VRLALPVVTEIHRWVRANHASLPTLADVASELRRDHLQSLLSQYHSISSQRAVTNVSAEIMLDLEDVARKSPYPPLHSMVGYYILDTREQLEPEQIDRLLTDLRNNPDIGLAYLEMGVQDAAVTPEDEPVYPANYKGHFDGRHRGINARNQKVWGVCDGAGIGLVDLEAGWNLDHEDLPRPLPPVFNHNRGRSKDHGTAVLGVIVGRDNAKGIVGLAPGARVLKVVSHIKSTGSQPVPMDEWDVAGAIYDALGIMKPGDVLLIEVQCIGPGLKGYPVETQEAWFTAIRNASGNGMIVVEAAGNGDSEGGRNLDDWQDPVTRRKLSRAPANDSGALLVSACASAVQPAQAHVRMGWANYGSRVDCYAWGENVYTAGYGNLTHPEPDTDLWYTDSFGGTSSASAIIAGAAILLQCLAVRKGGQRLNPNQVRTLLSGTGTSIVNTTGENIGIMPDLVKILSKLP